MRGLNGTSAYDTAYCEDVVRMWCTILLCLCNTAWRKKMEKSKWKRPAVVWRYVNTDGTTERAWVRKVHHDADGSYVTVWLPRFNRERQTTFDRLVRPVMLWEAGV